MNKRVHLRFLRVVVLFSVLALAFHGFFTGAYATETGGETSFDIKGFEVTGNSIFPADKLQNTVVSFIGQGKTAADVEKARDALEKLYHDTGYPAVMVNIPAQTLKEGIVKLQVIESRISGVKITGNKYFTLDKIMGDLPSLSPGSILYLPEVQKEIGRLNRGQDLKVEPVMSPGKELGTIDVELKVEDRLPLHGYLELNNRSSQDTSTLRLNAMVRYDNLWQKEHSLALQYQTSPQDPKQVEVAGGSYVLPAPWNEDHQLAFFGIWSDSDVAFGQGFEVIGKGQIVGMRYVVPLPSYHLYAHNITLGLDYKHFNQATGFTTTNGQTTHTPISYLPFSLSYNSSLPDGGGMTQFSLGLNMSFKGLVSDENEFELKRYKATADYLYATVGIQRTQKLPLGMGLFVKADAQISDGPLIDNEQYSAGGMESVRGFKESDALGDNAVHCTAEVSFPDPLQKLGIGKWFQATPFLFYDVARLTTKDPLPSQTGSITLEGAGAGIRGSMKHLEYEVDWAAAAHTTDNTKKDEQRVYFKIRALL